MIEEKKCPKCGHKEKVKNGFMRGGNEGIRTSIHKHFSKVCKCKIITIDFEEEVENS